MATRSSVTLSIAVAANLAMTGLTVVRAAEETTHVTNMPLIWETTERGKTGVQSQIASLYDALYELQEGGAKIETRQIRVVNESADHLLSSFRDEHLYVGNGENFPQSLDLLVCTLNSEKCAIEAGSKRGPRAKWKRITNELISVPNLKLEAVEQVQPYDKKRGDRISEIVVKERSGCERYDRECRKLVERLNQSKQKLEINFAGLILVPTTGYTTSLPLDAFASKHIVEGGILKNYSVTPTTADRFIGNVIRVPPSISPNSEQSSSTGTSLAEVYKLIHYYRMENIENRVLSIGLVDSNPDLNHCAFSWKTTATRDQLVEFDGRKGKPASALKQRISNSCGTFSSLTISEEEHGTHLLGLWFGMDKNRDVHSMLPIGDRTYVALGYLNYGELKQPAQYATIGRIVSSMSRSAQVINLSWGVPVVSVLGQNPTLSPQLDPVAESILRLRKAGSSPVLFVAAVGNERRDLGIGACDITPACPSRRKNVLTVTALSNDVKNPTVTGNFGRAVDLGVPAVDLVSLLRNDLTGKGSGSSQAAAIASAAASMLIYGTGLRPEQARTRMIYTSDMTPALSADDGRLFGGRLNFARAAGIDSELVAFNGLSERPAQKIIFADGTDSLIRFALPKRDGLLSLRFSQVRRLVRKNGLDSDRTHTVFYIDDQNELQRADGSITSASLKTPVAIKFEKKKPVLVTLKDIADFTAKVPTRPD